MEFLKNHPFAVEAFFKRSLVLTFAVTKEQLQKFIPECLELDTYNDKYAFVAVSMVETTGLRPKGFPLILGNDFFLIGYRIFVRYKNRAGKNLRGLFIIKSETNKKKMELLGNIFTHYNYSTTDISQFKEGLRETIRSEKSDFEVVIENSAEEVFLPEHSPFSDWKDARKFAGPLPHTFTYNEKTGNVLIIEGVRQFWNPVPVKVKEYKFEFLRSLNLQNIVLANAFKIVNIPYHWKKGRLEKWK